MTPVSLQEWIQHPEKLNRETLYEIRNLLARYPYFQSLRLLYLKNLYILHDVSFGAELRKSVLYVSDRRKLFQLIEGDRYEIHLCKGNTEETGDEDEEPSVDRTLALIDAFLATVPDEITPQTGFDYTTDYTAYLLESNQEVEQAEEGVPKLIGHDLIDLFIEKREDEIVQLSEQKSEEDVTATNFSDKMHMEEDEEDSYFTETLAKIYIKQQRYSKALEIIEKLSLKYPKKNAYFADQIRFLKKLIINANSK